MESVPPTQGLAYGNQLCKAHSVQRSGGGGRVKGCSVSSATGRRWQGLGEQPCLCSDREPSRMAIITGCVSWQVPSNTWSARLSHSEASRQCLMKPFELFSAHLPSRRGRESACCCRRLSGLSPPPCPGAFVRFAQERRSLRTQCQVFVTD